MAKNLHKPPPFDFSEYLPYLINRVGAALVVDFVQSALAQRRLSIGYQGNAPDRGGRCATSFLQIR